MCDSFSASGGEKERQTSSGNSKITRNKLRLSKKCFLFRLATSPLFYEFILIREHEKGFRFSNELICGSVTFSKHKPSYSYKTKRYMLNKKKILTAILATATTIVNAQQVVQLEPFTKIKVRSASNVTLKYGETNSIVLPDGADISQFKWNIKNDALIIEGRPQTVTVVAKQINEIDVQGTGSLTVSDTLHSENLELSISGSGSLSAPVVAGKIKADISGVGSVSLSGSADALDIEISGSGKVKAENLKVKNASAEISGTGTATVDATENLMWK